MAEMIELKETQERVILVGVSTSDHDDTEKSLDELEELAATAGAVTVGRVIQNLDQIHTATYVGKGKLDEIKDLIDFDFGGPLHCIVIPSKLHIVEAEYLVEIAGANPKILDDV